MKNILRSLAVLALLSGIFFYTAFSADAAVRFTNNDGRFDGDHKAEITNRDTNEVFEGVMINIEGRYVKFKIGDREIQGRFDEILDRRYEQEIMLRKYDPDETFKIIFGDSQSKKKSRK